MKYNLYDNEGNWLGTCEAGSPEEAVKRAQVDFSMPQTVRAEERDDNSGAV